MNNFKLNYAGVTLYFGLNSINNLVKYLNPYKSVVIATGKKSAKISGALDDLKRILSKQEIEYEIFDEITSNPWASQADKLAYFIWSGGFDAIIAIGGGSVIDTAKASSIVSINGRSIKEYMYEGRTIKKWLPVFAINITHGTGTEVDRYSVLTDDVTNDKVGFVSVYPRVSIDDPKYTVTLPKVQTIYTSLDAFYHAYESATTDNAFPFVSLLSKEAIFKIKEWLPKALNKPENIGARYWLLYASMIAGISIDCAGTHVIHVMEHILSGLNPKLAHACGLAIIGPRSVYYTHKLFPEKSAYVLKVLDNSIKPISEDAEKAENIVKGFQQSIGFKEKLSDHGFTEKDVERITYGAMGYLKEHWKAEIIKDILLRSF